MKKKIGLIILMSILIVGIAFIGYLNRTVSGDYISKMLKEKGVVKITIMEKDFGEGFKATKEMSDEEIADFLQLFEDSKFKIIRSNTYEVIGTITHHIDCRDSKGNYLATFSTRGEDFVEVYSMFLSQYSVSYRVQTKDWYERLELLAKP